MFSKERVGMAKIVFYDATDVDVEQLSQGLKDTDHYWEYCSDKLSTKTVREDAEVISTKGLFRQALLPRDKEPASG